MDIGIISNRYAKTLLRFANENQEAEKVYEEMLTLAESFRSVPALYETMLDPVLPASEKERLLVTATVGNGKPTSSTRQFLSLVLRNGRADLMTFIASSFVELYNKSNHLVRGRLVVPVKVSKATEQKLRSMLENRTEGSKVDITVKVDPTLGGGFVLEYDTYRLDASLKTQLATLQRALS